MDHFQYFPTRDCAMLVRRLKRFLAAAMFFFSFFCSFYGSFAFHCSGTDVGEGMMLLKNDKVIERKIWDSLCCAGDYSHFAFFLGSLLSRTYKILPCTICRSVELGNYILNLLDE